MTRCPRAAGTSTPGCDGDRPWAAPPSAVRRGSTLRCGDAEPSVAARSSTGGGTLPPARERLVRLRDGRYRHQRDVGVGDEPGRTGAVCAIVNLEVPEVQSDLVLLARDEVDYGADREARGGQVEELCRDRGQRTAGDEKHDVLRRGIDLLEGIPLEGEALGRNHGLNGGEVGEVGNGRSEERRTEGRRAGVDRIAADGVAATERVVPRRKLREIRTGCVEGVSALRVVVPHRIGAGGTRPDRTQGRHLIEDPKAELRDVWCGRGCRIDLLMVTGHEDVERRHLGGGRGWQQLPDQDECSGSKAKA